MGQADAMWEPLALAAALNVPPGRVWGWIHEGRVLAVKQGARMLIPKIECDRLLKRSSAGRKPRKLCRSTRPRPLANDPTQGRLQL